MVRLSLAMELTTLLNGKLHFRYVISEKKSHNIM